MKYRLELKCKGKGKDLEITQEEYLKQLDNPNFIKSFKENKPEMIGIIIDDENILHEVILIKTSEHKERGNQCK